MRGLRQLAIIIPDDWTDKMAEQFGDRIAGELAPGVWMQLTETWPEGDEDELRRWETPD